MKIDTALYNNEKRHQLEGYFIVDMYLACHIREHQLVINPRSLRQVQVQNTYSYTQGGYNTKSKPILAGICQFPRELPGNLAQNISMTYRQVILKTQPLSYSQDGHRMFPQRSSNAPSQKPGYFGGSCVRTVVHRVIFTAFFCQRKVRCRKFVQP